MTYYDYFATGLLGAVYLLIGLPFVRLARWTEQRMTVDAMTQKVVMLHGRSEIGVNQLERRFVLPGDARFLRILGNAFTAASLAGCGKKDFPHPAPSL
jgi:hypothetical protein